MLVVLKLRSLASPNPENSYNGSMSMKSALKVHVLRTWSTMKWGLEELCCGCYDLTDEFIQWSVYNLMGCWKVMDTYKAGSTSGYGSLGAYLFGYSLPCLSAPWSPWTEQFSSANLPTTSVISQSLKQCGGGGRTIIDENLWNGKYSPSLRGLSQYFFFLYSNRITGAFRHRKGSSEPNWRKSVWEGGPSQVEKSKEPALVALQLGVAVPALLDLDWSHCRAGGVQTCQPHSRDHR